MDLSGSMQGAGGVGGLLGVTEHGVSSDTDYYPAYDGNGNVSEYLDASGAVQAHYEYDAFGNTLVSSGAKANVFAHRFSTKPHDAETGLYYYGYRYYDPVTGRWPSRDPIGERGGLNVYGFVYNILLGWIDILGGSPDRIYNGGLPPVIPPRSGGGKSKGAEDSQVQPVVPEEDLVDNVEVPKGATLGRKLVKFASYAVVCGNKQVVKVRSGRVTKLHISSQFSAKAGFAPPQLLKIIALEVGFEIESGAETEWSKGVEEETTIEGPEGKPNMARCWCVYQPGRTFSLKGVTIAYKRGPGIHAIYNPEMAESKALIDMNAGETCKECPEFLDFAK